MQLALSLVSLCHAYHSSIYSGKNRLMRLKWKADEKWQNFFAFAPIPQKWLQIPSALHHDNPQVNDKQQQVIHPSNSKSMTFNSRQTLPQPYLITPGKEPVPFHQGPTAVTHLKGKIFLRDWLVRFKMVVKNGSWTTVATSISHRQVIPFSLVLVHARWMDLKVEPLVVIPWMTQVEWEKWEDGTKEESTNSSQSLWSSDMQWGTSKRHHLQQHQMLCMQLWNQQCQNQSGGTSANVQ